MDCNAVSVNVPFCFCFLDSIFSTYLQKGSFSFNEADPVVAQNSVEKFVCILLNKFTQGLHLLVYF